MMRKLIVLCVAMSLSACSSIPKQREQQKQLVKTVATIAVVLAVANALGDSNQKSKCQNNRAGFWQGTDGRIYTCP